MCGEKTAITRLLKANQGSPPRVRGKGIQQRNCWVTMRITPACAGKRRALPRSQPALGDHPRVCGEKVVLSIFLVPLMGSPPRVRGKERQQPRKHRVTRITPACAGKSVLFNIYQVIAEDHPRVCGEKARTLIVQDEPQGSPPRVRGKAALWRVSRPLFRITPACAGKSAKAERTSRCSWDHPRVCGEKDLVSRQLHFSTGSPPRVRGKAFAPAPTIDIMGITPACAGKRPAAWAGAWRTGDHPRVCGEKKRFFRPGWSGTGSPPRVRGKETVLPPRVERHGITPACAGKRALPDIGPFRRRDHPRVCGEKRVALFQRGKGVGSPPRVRGKVPFLFAVTIALGITPACAGKSRWPYTAGQ